MSLKEFITRKAHDVFCKPGRIPQADWGCCGCGAERMDAYLTVGCDFCGAAGAGYCWSCIDQPDWPEHITLADFTVLPGRGRPAQTGA